MKKRPIRIEGDIAYVPLTRGYEAVIDASDVHLVEGHNWTAKVRRARDGRVTAAYAVRSARIDGRQVTIRMHRVIAGTPDGLETDHVDCNGLNNRRSNLRAVTTAQNHYNIGRNARNTSGFKGVTWNKRFRKWAINFTHEGKRKHLGYFTTAEQAAEVYANAVSTLRGEFGRAA